MPEKNVIILTARTKRFAKRVVLVFAVIAVSAYVSKIKSDNMFLLDAVESYKESTTILERIVDRNLDS